MQKVMSSTFFSSLVISLSLLAPSLTYADITVGVLAPRGELKAIKRWSEFGSYLSNKIGEKVKILPLAPPKVVATAKQGKLDFILSNPVHTLKLVEAGEVETLGTLAKKSGAQFAGVIVAKKGRGILKSADLKGKKVMSLKFKSAAGAYVFQTYHLQQKGIDPHKDFASMKAGKKQDDLILAVNAGIIDAAFVRSGILEAMNKEGKIKINDFVVVDQKSNDSLPLAHTTQLYPEWYLSASSKTDANIKEKVKSAALALSATDKATVTGKIKGFVEPISLDSMKTAFKALKIAPFN